MSDILVIDRQDNLHIVDYCSPNGNKYALCGVTYVKKDIVTTLAIDNTISILCHRCHSLFTAMYESDLNDEPQSARGKLQERLERDYQHIQIKAADTAAKYEDTVNEKYWYKLNAYKRKLQRK
jgi:hypothetical protein